MGKLKTKKGVAKRFKLHKSGKIKYLAGGKSHLATCKNVKRIRKLSRAKVLGDKKKIQYLKRMLPYG